MKAVVNEQTINNVAWSANEGTGVLQFQTSRTIAELEEIFNSSNATSISIYTEENQLEEMWYLRTLNEISCKRANDEWDASVTFKVSAIDNNSEAEIRGSISDSDDALIELAGMISDIADSLENTDSRIQTHQEILDRISNLYDALADRVAILENK